MRNKLFIIFGGLLLLLRGESAYTYQTVISSGFEQGNLSAWSNDENGATITSDAHSGVYAAKYVPCGACHFGKTKISPTFREAYLRMWVKFSGDIPTANPGPGGMHFWRFVYWPNENVGFQQQIDMGMWQQTYTANFYLGGDKELYYTSLFVKNAWQKHVIRMNLATKQFVYEVDGKKMVDIQGTDFVLGWAGGFDTFIFTNYDYGSGGFYNIDDVLFLTGTGAYNFTEAPQSLSAPQGLRLE